MTGTNRLSPYFGTEVFYARNNFNVKGTNFEITNGWMNNQSVRSNSSIGLKLFAGADFYVARPFYLGVEFALGYSRSTFDDISSRSNNQTIVNAGSERSDLKISNQGGIRVGYAFY